jgi:predicted AlkP superfamily phosphohydrolase/phosphomutase
MPTLARLLDDAAVADTVAPAGVFVSANWPTIFTASSPDRHGYLCWDEIRGASYEDRQTSPREVRGAPLWRRMSEAGRRVAVLDVPHSLVEPLNGVMVSEWGCHDRHHGTESWPGELAGELSERHGRHFGTAAPPGFDQFAPCDYVHRGGRYRSADEEAELFESIQTGLERKRAASLELLDRGGWDFFLTVMGEGHCVGHQLWHLHDQSHPGYDAALVARLGGDPVEQVYERLDGVLAEHLARLSPEDTAYVLMPHGMTAHHDGTHLLDQVLHRLDQSLEDPGGFGSATRAAAEVARLIPHPLRGRALRAAAPLLRARAGSPEVHVLPPRRDRRWFQTPNNTVVGAVRLNLEGREPCGRLHPEDRRKVLRWLGDRLGELVNLDSGGRVVRRCEIAEDVYRRSLDDAFGDLFVEWERTAPIERVWSPATGTVAVPYEHWRQGDHVREGLLLATGPGIAPGRRRRAFGTADVGATVAAATGVELPEVDGGPIGSLLPDGATARRRAGIAARARQLAQRRAEKRVPDWAHRIDPVLDRFRREASARAERLEAGVESLQRDVGDLGRKAEIATMAAWLPHAEVAEELLISVVMPTRNRRRLLESAIASVKAQAYPHWELLVVDDGSTDDTAEFLEDLDDPRIRPLASHGVGVCAARNLALNAANGDLIAYLDDDNRFDRQWLKAVALTFNARPETRVCYGARVYDDEGREHGGESSARPGVQFVGWDRRAIREGNFVDMSSLAHRRGKVRFDESLSHLGDWDLLLRLAEEEGPVEVPTIASYYRTDAPQRITNTITSGELDREFDHVRRKLGAGVA